MLQFVYKSVLNHVKTTEPIEPKFCWKRAIRSEMDKDLYFCFARPSAPQALKVPILDNRLIELDIINLNYVILSR